MQEFEKLGVFYLGKQYDLEQGKLQDEVVLYKSKDLTTHAVIIGMTGSGKTGLGISILEEAAIDQIPVIAIDPKGDLGNMALTFPELRTEDFRPWVNPQEASNKDMTVDEYAAVQATSWQKGLADWGQDGNRIQKLRDTADITVYTPGSSAGVGVSALRAFSAPPSRVKDDKDAYRDLINAMATSILALVGLDADPLVSREHILISGIIENAWEAGLDLSLADLIISIQNPPIKKVGVMDIESFYPSKERFELAMRLNSLLASPSFKAWMEGEPLDVNRFLYGQGGKPQVSIFSIAHLTDSERMFFVTMLLNEILAWVRTQPGTGSLRAILYIDELCGYLPPTANPPSKTPLMTLLKQARAFGLGLVLSTQNPVDLDYKALSNAGTWFIGRLQTERDKERVMAGLEGAAAGGQFNRIRTEQILAGLSQRTFYLHSVYENEAVIFQTRWVLSYLAGPMTREQIAALPSSKMAEQKTSDNQSAEKPVQTAGDNKKQPRQGIAASTPPVLPPQVKQIYLPAAQSIAGGLIYVPGVIGVADVKYTSSKYGVDVSRRCMFVSPVKDGPIPLDWQEAKLLETDIRDLEEQPREGAAFADYPQEAANVKMYDQWQKLFIQFLRTKVDLKLLESPALKVISQVDETERDFRVRLQHLAREHRDEAIEGIRNKYASKMDTLEDRRRRAIQTLDRENDEASQKKMSAAITTGTALLGAIFGNKRISASSVSRVGSAVRNASKAMNGGDDINRAREALEAVENQLQELETELQQEIEKVAKAYDTTAEKLEEVTIRPTAAGIVVHMLGLAWTPLAD